MKYRFALLSPFAAALFVFASAQTSGCNGALDDSGDAGPDGGDAQVAVGDEFDEFPVPVLPDGSVSCQVSAGTDYIDFCLQKQILLSEHAVFNPSVGLASSWNANTGKPDTDGGAIVHSFYDDVAYASSLSLYAISAQEYGDTQIQSSVLVPDMTALATIIEAELATTPASYDGELYMRLRRFAAGLRAMGGLLETSDATTAGAAIDAIAEVYGRAIYASYFHALTGSPDAGAADAGPDAGDDAGEGGVADAAVDAAVPPAPVADGILGVPQPGGGILYDVDQAASGALALVDLASRHETDDPTHAHIWALAAGSVLNHLYARARHTSGLYYAYLVTSGDPGHDALAPSAITPNDALLSETQGSVAASLMRALGIVQNANMAELSAYPFDTQVLSPLNGLQGVAPGGGVGLSLWDPTQTTDTATTCASLPDASSCFGSGFFVRYLPSLPGIDNREKTIRANALVWSAIHRSLVTPGTVAGIDDEPLTALFESQNGVNQSFLSLTFEQSSYPNAVSASLALLPASPSFTAQADAYAIEALTEQWLGEPFCPPDFF